MNKKILCAALLGGLSFANHAMAQEFDDRWYLTGSAGFNLQDDDRTTRNAPFLGLGLLAWALVTGTRRRNWPMLLIAAPMLVQLGGIVLFSIAGEYRYILPFFALPLVLLPMYMLQIKTKSDTD